MYNRALLKKTARDRLVLGGRWLAVAVALVASALIGGSGSLPGFSFNVREELPSSSSAAPSFGSESRVVELFESLLPVFIGIASVAMLFGVAYMILVGNIALVGMRKWFLNYSRSDTPSFVLLFDGFRSYSNVLKTMFLHDLYITLWSLLFIIPGIVKSFSFRLVPYLLSDNPTLSPKEALRMSETMMNGWKWKAFVFDLSFFWWHMLNAITLGIVGILYFNPYYYTADAYFYDLVKYDALYTRRVIDPSTFAAPAEKEPASNGASTAPTYTMPTEPVSPTYDAPPAPYLPTDQHDFPENQ